MLRDFRQFDTPILIQIYNFLGKEITKHVSIYLALRVIINQVAGRKENLKSMAPNKSLLCVSENRNLDEVLNLVVKDRLDVLFSSYNIQVYTGKIKT